MTYSNIILWLQKFEGTVVTIQSFDGSSALDVHVTTLPVNQEFEITQLQNLSYNSKRTAQA